MQDAVEAGEGSRGPATGHVFVSTGIWIGTDDGEAEMSAEELRWGEALQVIEDHHDRAVAHAEDHMQNTAAETRQRWRDIARRIKIVFDAAERDAQVEASG